jgi:hypothetical protein
MEPGAILWRSASAAIAGASFTPSGDVPEHVQRESAAGAGQRVHLTGIAELLLDRRGSRRLKELAEPRAGIRETPRGQLDLEAIERPPDDESGRRQAK